MKKRKIVSLCMAAAVMLSGLSIQGANPKGSSISKAADDSALIAHYEFQEENISEEAANVQIKDVSGNGNDASVLKSAWGNGVSIQNGCELYLAGGDKNSPNYVTLPGNMFVNQNALTITFWMKNETAVNYYAGMFFGADNKKYWFFTPRNQNGAFKSVIASNGSDSEQGISPWQNVQVVGPQTDGNWNMYTTVITPDSITGYYNGVSTGTVNIGTKISDFGTNLISYIGKSAYDDALYQGGVMDVRVYEGSFTDSQVAGLYSETEADMRLAEQIEKDLEIPEAEYGSVYTYHTPKVTLPAAAGNGHAQITWSSSNEACISSTGVVTPPLEETEVTLTAKIKVGALSRTKHITLTVLPKHITEIQTKYHLDIDKNKEGSEISQELFGLFYEDINSSADGGLNPEMVKNYSFENYINDRYVYNVGDQNNWKWHWVESGTGTFTVLRDEDGTESLNDKNPNYAVITGNKTLRNGGFAPKNNTNGAAMPMKEGCQFDFSMFMKAESNYSGSVYVQVENAAGQALTEKEEVTLEKTGEWTKVSAVLTADATEKGKLVLSVEDAGSADELYIDMVSLLPTDTYGYGDINYAYGAGLRKDLVEMLRDLNPSFMRFPGGCIIEGDGERANRSDTVVKHVDDWKSYYNWEESIGPLEERRSIANRWETNWGSGFSYMQSRGFGYHEMLKLCEDFEMEPFPILSAGVLCQYEAGDLPAATGVYLEKFAKHATNLIDYCWGSTDSTNAVQREWAQKRTDNGQEEPFNLNYIGIGNENWQAKYLNNFDYITNYINHYVETNYPGRSIKVISSTGPSSDGTNYEFAWEWFNDKYAGDLLVDEHYYQDVNFMTNNTDRYDYYNRLENGGSDVFVGEYATHVNGRANNLESALSDAAYITGLERNGDIVRHTSYAPLFCKEGSTDWQTDLIWFDEYESYGTPNYYVQQMFAQNYGERIVNTKLSAKGENYTQNTGGIFLGTYATAVEVDRVKVVRSDGVVLLEEDFSDSSATKGKWTNMSGGTGGFSISGGKLTINNTSGWNAVWIPETLNSPEWYDYKVETVVKKLSGNEGFMLGVGVKDGDNYYSYNMGGSGNTITHFERQRAPLGNKRLGNQFKSGFKAIPTNAEMTVKVNYGVDDKLEAGYTTADDDSKEFDFSSNLKPYQTDIYEVVSVDEEYIYVKLVNNESEEKVITLSISDYMTDPSRNAEVICLTGSRSATNSIAAQPIQPVVSEVAVNDDKVIYTVPKDSFSVVKIPLAEEGEIPSVSLKALEITPPAKLSYRIGEKFDLSGMTVTAVYDDNSKKALASGSYTVSGFDSSVPGNKNVVISYTENGITKTASFTITVKADEVKQYKIQYQMNGGKNNPSNPSAYTTGTVTLKNPTRAKYIFKGWYTDSKFKSKITKVSGKDITVYAKWQKVTVKKAKIQSLKNKNGRKLTVKIKKTAGAKGYEISYSAKKTFKKKDTRKLTLIKRSKTINKLKKGKTYFVRVRAYKLDSAGKKVYGKYSTKKKIAISK